MDKALIGIFACIGKKLPWIKKVEKLKYRIVVVFVMNFKKIKNLEIVSRPY